jgi:type I restriction enzyme S subunit
VIKDSNSAKWEELSFDEAVEPISDEGKRIDQRNYQSSGALPVIDQGESFIGGYTDDLSKSYTGPLPIVVFGDHTRRVKLVSEPFAVGAQGVKLLRPREGWSVRFFAYLLRTLPIPSRGYSRHYQFVRKLKFPRPPLGQQQRIVAEIEKQFTRLDTGVASMERVQTALKRYRASVLNAACAGRLHKGSGPWQRRKLGEVTTKIGSGSTPRGGDDVYVSEGIPFIRSLNVRSTGFRREGLAYINETHANQLKHVVVTPRDVLLNITGASIGRVAVAPPDLEGGRVSQHVCILRSTADLLPQFLQVFLASPREQSRIMNVQVGATRQALTKAMLTKWEIPVPSISEQEQIVAEVERRLSVTKELENIARANFARANRLRQSILENAFKD